MLNRRPVADCNTYGLAYAAKRQLIGSPSIILSSRKVGKANVIHSGCEWMSSKWTVYCSIISLPQIKCKNDFEQLHVSIILIRLLLLLSVDVFNLWNKFRVRYKFIHYQSFIELLQQFRGMKACGKDAIQSSLSILTPHKEEAEVTGTKKSIFLLLIFVALDVTEMPFCAERSYFDPSVLLSFENI